MEAIGGAKMRAHQATCTPAAPCSRQAGLRTYRAQLVELIAGRAFPLAQWLPLLQAMTGVPSLSDYRCGCSAGMVANHAPASRFISLREVRGETPGISANFTRYLPPSRARAENSTPVSTATDATQQITAFFRRSAGMQPAAADSTVGHIVGCTAGSNKPWHAGLAVHCTQPAVAKSSARTHSPHHIAASL